MEEKILILDFGSQYTQLIARRVRELNIYCEIFPYNKAPKNIENFKGLILSGSPFSVHDVEAPSVNLEEFKNHIKKYHTVNGKPDGSLHEENGYYFRVDFNFYKELFG